MITVEPDSVTIKGGQTFGCVDCEVSVFLLCTLVKFLLVLSTFTYNHQAAEAPAVLLML